MDYSFRLLLLICYGCTSSLWLRYVVSKPQPGVSRLILSTPFLFGNVISPVFFDVDREICTSLACYLSFLWLGTFKVCQNTWWQLQAWVVCAWDAGRRESVCLIVPFDADLPFPVGSF